MNNLKELKIWNKAIDLTVEVYNATSKFLSDERFGLTSQIRRATVSVPSNIAEGTGRNSPKEVNNFLGISNGSFFELQTQLIVANKLDIVPEEILNPILIELDILQKMTYGFQQMLEKKFNKKQI